MERRDVLLPSIVVVVGMHRSGTSLCSHVLDALGFRMADAPGAGPGNPTGHWERLEIVALHDRILKLFNRGYFDPLHDLPLPHGWWLDPRVVPFRKIIRSNLKRWLASGTPVGFKDPRTVRLFALWQELSAELNFDLKVVLCLRNPAEVSRSLNQRDGLPLDLGEYRWFLYMADIVDALRDRDVCTIEYEQWFDGTGRNAEKLIGFLGLGERESRAALTRTILRVVDERLSHSSPVPCRPDLQLVTSLYEVSRGFDTDAAARAEAVRIVDQFRAHQQLYAPLMRKFEELSESVVLKQARIRLRRAVWFAFHAIKGT